MDDEEIAKRVALPDRATGIELSEGLVLIELPHSELVFPDSLTGAEREIAALVVSGLTSAEIAARRRVSVKTVHAQVEAVFCKCLVTDRVELVAVLTGM